MTAEIVPEIQGHSGTNGFGLACSIGANFFKMGWVQLIERNATNKCLWAESHSNQSIGLSSLPKRLKCGIAMTEERQAQIEEMLREDPDDVMLQYMLAMELDSNGKNDESLALYEKLMKSEPPHVDSYFRFAQQKVRLGEIEPARSALRTGIDVARKQDRGHTAAEMSELLQSLGDLGE